MIFFNKNVNKRLFWTERRQFAKKKATMRFIYDQPLAISLESKAKDTYSDIVYEPLLYVEDPIKNSKGNGERKLPVGILLGGR